MSEKKTIWKKMLIFLLAIALIFVVINLVWYVGVKLKYDEIEEKLSNCEIVKIFEVEEVGVLYEDCVIGVRHTSYLQNSGYVCVTDIKEFEPFINIEEGKGIINDDCSVTLMYWPQLFSEDRYGIDITKNGTSEHIYVDKEGNFAPLEEVDSEQEHYAISLLDEYREEIDKLLATLDKLLSE